MSSQRCTGERGVSRIFGEDCRCLEKRGWGGVGGEEWSLTRVAINFDPFEKISHSWVCHERPSQRALMVAYM